MSARPLAARGLVRQPPAATSSLFSARPQRTARAPSSAMLPLLLLLLLLPSAGGGGQERMGIVPFILISMLCVGGFS